MSVTDTDSSSASASSTPLTVTDRAVDQFPVVNNNVPQLTDTAPESPDDTLTETCADGRVANLSSKVPEPFSEIGRLPGSTSKFTVSSSVTDTATVAVRPP